MKNIFITWKKLLSEKNTHLKKCTQNKKLIQNLKQKLKP